MVNIVGISLEFAGETGSRLVQKAAVFRRRFAFVQCTRKLAGSRAIAVSRGCQCRSPPPVPSPNTNSSTWRKRRPAHSMRCSPTRCARCARRSWSRAAWSAKIFDREQRAAHGLAWLATYVEAVRQLTAYAERMTAQGRARRARGTSGAHRPRRMPVADRRRHSDQPGRDRAPGRLRPDARAGRRALQSDGRDADRDRQHRRASRPCHRADEGERTTPPSAPPASTTRWNRSARRCANSPTAKSSATRRTGIAPTATSRWKSSRRCRTSACSG